MARRRSTRRPPINSAAKSLGSKSRWASSNRHSPRYNRRRLPLTPGTRLGVYEIVALLGAGGMGEVYRARDTRLGRDVALKVLPADVSSDPDRLARFEREARAVAGLNHPNIVVLHSLEEEGGT